MLNLSAHPDPSNLQAYTIRQLHRGKTGAESARKKAIAMAWAFCIVFVYKVASGYAPGIVRLFLIVNWAYWGSWNSANRSTIGILGGLCTVLASRVQSPSRTMAGSSNLHLPFSEQGCSVV